MLFDTAAVFIFAVLVGPLFLVKRVFDFFLKGVVFLGKQFYRINGTEYITLGQSLFFQDVLAF